MTKTTMHKFKFSFVMPVYNVEAYLAETVESVLMQTLDFEQNCEIIFVNDGSPDNVEEVCLRYQQRYPANIKYIKQKNAGLSAARNRGIKEAEGKYVSFLDSDDKISPNTLGEVYKFFESHYDEIDFVSMKIQYFEGKEGEHQLNYKAQKTRVINVEEDFDQLHIQVASSFLKREVLDEFYFNPKIRRFAEDMELLGRLVLEKMAYGVVSKPVYYYRKRSQGGSIVDSSFSQPEWYEQTPTAVYDRILIYAKEKLGYIPKYIQFMVMYDLQWRLKQTGRPDFSDEFINRYKEMLIHLIKKIDDDVIASQKHLDLNTMLYVYGLKYGGKRLTNLTRVNDWTLYVGDTEVFDFKENPPHVIIELLDRQKEKVILEGFVNYPAIDGLTLEFTASKGKAALTRVERQLRKVYFLGEFIYEPQCYHLSVAFEHGQNIGAQMNHDDDSLPLPLSPRKHTRINHSIGGAYRIIGKFALRRYKNRITIRNYRPYMRFMYELQYQFFLLCNLKLLSSIVRLGYFLAKLYYGRKDIWIVSDRVNAGGDNGEAFFRYAVKKHVGGNKRLYFAVSKKSGDYERLQKHGKVINRYGPYYFLIFFFANKVISSHADDFVINPYGGKEHNLSDLFRFDFVFLQHGIIHNDLSGWLNRYNKDIKLFVTSTKQEHDSIIEGNYGYSGKQVKLTGLPRYDFLKSQPKNKLILAPTWRHNLIGDADAIGVRQYNAQFKNSDYYKFYQSLINDKDLNNLLKNLGMTGEFYLHPSLSPQVTDFTETEQFKVKKFPYDYRTAFNEGNVLVTDYSSVAFDFAYLKKPIVYSQYDRDSFYKNHMHKEGYFSYEKDGFGPVAYDYATTVKEITKALKENEPTSKYLDRMKKFFYKIDTKNSARVYEAILELETDKR